MEETHAPVLVRMPIEQKNALHEEAKKNARTLTGEINERLRISLAAHGPTAQTILAREAFPVQPAPSLAPGGTYPTGTAKAHLLDATTPTNANGPANALSDIDQAMLDIFRALPVKKRLALLSLFE